MGWSWGGKRDGGRKRKKQNAMLAGSRESCLQKRGSASESVSCMCVCIVFAPLLCVCIVFAPLLCLFVCKLKDRVTAQVERRTLNFFLIS